MEAGETLRKIAALPPEAQSVVFDLLDTLSKRYAAPKKAKRGQQMKGLRSDPFIGMWRDRDDMAEPAHYVHDLRRNEWNRKTNHA